MFSHEIFRIIRELIAMNYRVQIFNERKRTWWIEVEDVIKIEVMMDESGNVPLEYIVNDGENYKYCGHDDLLLLAAVRTFIKG